MSMARLSGIGSPRAGLPAIAWARPDHVFHTRADHGYGIRAMGIFPDGMGGVAPFDNRTSLREEVDQTSAFGHVNLSLSRRAMATAGIRINQETRRTDNFADNNGFVSDLAGDQTFDQLIPSVSLSYSLTGTTSVGASYARGYQAGGMSFAAFLGQANAYDEEYTNNYEVFVRHRTNDGRLTLNANVFSIDWYDQQVPFTPDFGIPQFDIFVANVGESTVRGVEVESEYYFTRNLELFASVGLVDSQFQSFNLDGVDLSGMSFPRSPDWNASIGLGWHADGGWFAYGTYGYTGSSYPDLAAPGLTTMSARNVLGVRGGYRFKGCAIYAWGTNLLDSDYEIGLFDGRLFGIPEAYGRVSEPRVVGLGIEYSW